MATVNGSYSVSLQDYLGVPVSHLIQWQAADSTTLATLETVFNNYNTLLQGIAGGKGIRSTITFDGPLAGWSGSPTAGDESEKTGLFNFSQTGSTRKQGIDVPTIKETKIVEGKLPLTDTDIAAWAAWFVAAHSGVTPTSPYGLVFAAILDSLITFRKHRKAESRRSLVVG